MTVRKKTSSEPSAGSEISPSTIQPEIRSNATVFHINDFEGTKSAGLFLNQHSDRYWLNKFIVKKLGIINVGESD